MYRDIVRAYHIACEYHKSHKDDKVDETIKPRPNDNPNTYNMPQPSRSANISNKPPSRKRRSPGRAMTAAEVMTAKGYASLVEYVQAESLAFAQASSLMCDLQRRVVGIARAGLDQARLAADGSDTRLEDQVSQRLKHLARIRVMFEGVRKSRVLINELRFMYKMVSDSKDANEKLAELNIGDPDQMLMRKTQLVNLLEEKLEANKELIVVSKRLRTELNQQLVEVRSEIEFQTEISKKLSESMKDDLESMHESDKPLVQAFKKKADAERLLTEKDIELIKLNGKCTTKKLEIEKLDKDELLLNIEERQAVDMLKTIDKQVRTELKLFKDSEIELEILKDQFLHANDNVKGTKGIVYRQKQKAHAKVTEDKDKLLANRESVSIKLNDIITRLNEIKSNQRQTKIKLTEMRSERQQLELETDNAKNALRQAIENLNSLEKGQVDSKSSQLEYMEKIKSNNDIKDDLIAEGSRLNKIKLIVEKEIIHAYRENMAICNSIISKHLDLDKEDKRTEIKSLDSLFQKLQHLAYEEIKNIQKEQKAYYDIYQDSKREIIGKEFNGGQYINPSIYFLDPNNVPKDSRSISTLVEMHRYEWPRSDKSVTSDFATLLRKSILAVLANQGFISREIFVDNGKKIAVILSLRDDSIRYTLETMKIKRAVDFGMVDILSLEPLDSHNRSLRLSKYLNDPEVWSKAYNTKEEDLEERAELQTIRDQILSLLATDCNMKQISDLCGCEWPETEEDNWQSINNHAKVDKSIWRSYHKFLIQLACRLGFIRLNRTRMLQCKDQYEVYYNKQIDKNNLKELDPNVRKAITEGYQNRDTRKLKERMSKCELNIHKFTVREIQKAFEESHTVIADLVSRQESHEMRQLGTLKTIWSELGVNSMQYYLPYKTAQSYMSKKERFKVMSIWKQYGKVSNPDKLPHAELIEEKPKEMNYGEFSEVERLKACQFLINKVINMDMFELILDGLETRQQGVAGQLNKISPLRFIFGDGSRLFPLHNRGELTGEDYAAVFKTIFKEKKIFDQLYVEKDYAESKGRRRAFAAIKKETVKVDSQEVDLLDDNAAIDIIGLLSNLINVKLHEELDEHHPINTINSDDQGNPIMTLNSEVNNISDREITIPPGTNTKNFPIPIYLPQAENEVKKDRVTKLDESELNSAIVESREKFLKIESQLLDPIKRDVKSAEKYTNHGSVVGHKLGESPKKLQQRREKEKRELRERSKLPKAFMSPLIRSVYCEVERDHDWEMESLGNDEGVYGADFIEQIRTEIKKNLKLSKRYYSTVDCELAIMTAINNRQSVANVIPSIFKERSTSDFLDNNDLEIDHPVINALKQTFWRNVTKFQERTIVRYFGEKVALLLAFNNFFRDWLVFMSIFGLIYVGFEMYTRIDDEYQGGDSTSYQVYQIISSIFCVILSYRKTRFIVNWQRFERLFSERNGTTGIEEAKVVRTQFKAPNKRSLATDEVNEQENKRFMNKIKQLVAAFVLLMYCVATGACCYFLLLTKRRINSLNLFWDVRFLSGSVSEVIFDFAEFIRIKLFDRLFLNVTKRMTRWLNFKFVEDHDFDICLRLSLFQFVNNSMIIWLITYDHFSSYRQDTGIDSKGIKTFIVKSDICFNKDCKEELTTYFIIYTLFQLLWAVAFNLAIGTIFTKVILKTKLLTRRHLRDKKKARAGDQDGFMAIANAFKIGSDKPKVQQRSSPSNKNRTRPKKQVTERHQELMVSNQAVNACYTDRLAMYRHADKEIEKQVVLLASYDDREDFDKASLDYLYLVNAFSYIVMYGTIFSHCYFTVWLMMASEYSVIRKKLLTTTKRPKPRAVNTIGMWLAMIKIASRVSVLTNSMYIAFFVYSDDNLEIQLLLLLFLIVLLSLVDYFSSFTIKDEQNDTAAILSQRSNFIRGLAENPKFKAVKAEEARYKANRKNLIAEADDGASKDRAYEIIKNNDIMPDTLSSQLLNIYHPISDYDNNLVQSPDATDRIRKPAPSSYQSMPIEKMSILLINEMNQGNPIEYHYNKLAEHSFDIIKQKIDIQESVKSDN